MLWGSPSSILLSMNAPGSPSSALQSTYFLSLFDFLVSSHLRPVGNPAPPLPLRPDFLISSMTCSGVISVNAFASALYPSKAIYSSIFSGLMTPQFLSATLTWRLKKSTLSSDFVVSSASLSPAMSLFTGLPFMRCSLTISSTSSTFTIVYITPSGYTTTMGPSAQRPKQPVVTTFTSLSRLFLFN